MGTLGRREVAALGAIAVVLAPSWAAATATASGPASPGTPTIAVHAVPAQIESGQRATLKGTATSAPGAPGAPGAAGGAEVRLYASPYPYPTATLAARTTTASDGSYSFVVSPDRNTRYRVELTGTPASAAAEVDVSGKVLTQVRALPLGAAGVEVLIFHPRDLRWGGAPVRWAFGLGRRGRLYGEPSTRSVRLSPYVTMLRTAVTLPAGRFRWRACLHAPGDHALANPRRPLGCTGRGYYGSGSLPVGYPGPGAISRAAGVRGSRAGRTAFAVVDSEGRTSGVHEHWTFVSASVIKAMLLVAYLRRLDARGQRRVDSYSNSFLYPMINVSDNNAATQCWSIVGDSGLYAIARAAGMTDFSISGIWANAQISAADQANLFFEMDSLIPRQFVGYARFLLSTITGYESWGIPAVARPRGYSVFFKGGWRGTGLGQLVHQVGRLEGHGVTFSIGVMTDADPSMSYGIDTIQAITGALL